MPWVFPENQGNQSFQVAQQTVNLFKTKFSQHQTVYEIRNKKLNITLISKESCTMLCIRKM